MNGLKYLIAFLFFTSCIHRQTSFDSITISRLLDKNLTLSSKSAEIILLDTIENDILYRINFSEVL